MMKTLRHGTLSIVLQSYQSADTLEPVVHKVLQRMSDEQISCELIIMDDGSTDKSFAVARSLEKMYPAVKAYQLSRNVTTPYAQFAGMHVATGDCVVSVPDDLQRPLGVVVRMYRKWQEGHQIIIGYRIRRNDGWLNDFFSKMYYRMMNTFSAVNFPPGGADGFLADREVIDIINQRIHPINTSTVVEVLRLGFDPLFIPYERPKARARSRWTFRKKVRLAMDTFFASSSLPIRLITLLGFGMAFLSGVLIILIVLAKIFSDNTLFGLPIHGWATSIVIMALFHGITLFSLGVVAEYIWRIYEEVKNRPGYIVRNNSEEE